MAAASLKTEIITKTDPYFLYPTTPQVFRYRLGYRGVFSGGNIVPRISVYCDVKPIYNWGVIDVFRPDLCKCLVICVFNDKITIIYYN